MNKLGWGLAILFLLFSGAAYAQTPLETYIYTRSASTSTSGLRVPTAPSSTASTLQYFGLDSSAFAFNGGNLTASSGTAGQVWSTTPTGHAWINLNSVATSISASTTLTSTAAGQRIPLTGYGYTVFLPTSTSSVLPATTAFTLVAQNGAGPFNICPIGSTSVFETASSAPLVSNICPSGQPGVVIWNGMSATISVDGSNNYHVTLAAPMPQTVTAQAYFACATTTCPLANDSNLGNYAYPFATVQACVNAAMAGNPITTCYVRKGQYVLPSNGSGCANTAGVVLNSNNVSGVTLSYWPPDGLGSADLDGATNTPALGVCVNAPSSGHNANNVSIIGLTISNTTNSGIRYGGYSSSQAANNALVAWNYIINTTRNTLCNTTFGGGIEFTGGYYQSANIVNNYLYNLQNHGISDTGGVANGRNNTVISGNIIEVSSACGGLPNTNDSGGIYTDEAVVIGTCPSTPITISNNYITNASKAIYLDDGSGCNTVTGNIIIAPRLYCFLYHGGDNNVGQYNVCDLGGANGASTSADIVLYQASGSVYPMTGNTFKSNIVVCKTTGASCGGGYAYSNTIPAGGNLSVANNTYFNYGSGATVATGCTGSGAGGGACAGETNGQTSNPSITCWNTLVSPSSVAFNSPFSFVNIPYSFGPPGLVGPAQNTTTTDSIAPSWGPTC